MTSSAPTNVTQLLLAWSDGDQAALDQLVPLIYDELRRLARRYMAREHAGHTLQTTALVNEAYMRLVDWKNVRWQNRAHFFGVSAQLMRRLLVDFARARRQIKRAGQQQRVSFEDALAVAADRGADILALDDALKTLALLNERQARVVEMRFFGGLSEDEIAEVLKVTEGAVRYDWRMAKAWLHRALAGSQA